MCKIKTLILKVKVTLISQRCLVSPVYFCHPWRDFKKTCHISKNVYEPCWNKFAQIFIFIHFIIHMAWNTYITIVSYVVDFKPFSPHHFGFETLGCRIFHVQLAYGRSMVLPRYPLGDEIMHEGAPGVFLHHESWNVAVWSRLFRCNVKLNNINKLCHTLQRKL